MAEINRWSGNVTSEISIYDNELTELVDFMKLHSVNYIFGSGKIGKALGHYLNQSGLEFEGYMNSTKLLVLNEIYEKGKTGIIIGMSDKNYHEAYSELMKVVAKEDVFVLSAGKRENMANMFSVDEIEKNFWINIYVTNQCNLNCKSCSAFAPICAPDYYDFKQFKKDIVRMSMLKLTSIAVLKFTGGEPFLHPQLFDMFASARSVFPDIQIECYTNGLLLKSLKDDMLLRLRELKITLIITEYPVENLDLNEVYKRADIFGVSYSVIYSEGKKFFSKRPLNFEKKTPKHMFYYCPRFKMCYSLFLFEGRLFKCIYALSSEYVNKAFNKNLVLEKEDYLDLYNTSPNEIYEYFISRIPYCGYCSPIEELIPWSLSDKIIEEWT